MMKRLLLTLLFVSSGMHIQGGNVPSKAEQGAWKQRSDFENDDAWFEYVWGLGGDNPLYYVCDLKGDDEYRMVQLRSGRTRTALHEASLDIYSEACFERVLNEWDKEVDVEDHNQRTPLHWAAGHYSTKKVRLLLLRGADPNHRSCPLAQAAFHAVPEELVRLLLDRGARSEMLSRDMQVRLEKKQYETRIPDQATLRSRFDPTMNNVMKEELKALDERINFTGTFAGKKMEYNDIYLGVHRLVDENYRTQEESDNEKKAALWGVLVGHDEKMHRWIKESLFY